MDAGSDIIERLTARRDGSRWTRPEASIETPPEDGDSPVDWSRGLGVLLLWALAIIGGFVLLFEGHDAVAQPLAGAATAEPVAAVSVLVTAALAGWAWVLSKRYGYRSRPPAFRFALSTAIVGGVFGFLLITDIGNAHRLVEDYCSYGAVSSRQLATCKTHVTANYVRSHHTLAARFAIDGSSDAVCGAGSGQFCQRVLNYRYIQEQEPAPGQ